MHGNDGGDVIIEYYVWIASRVTILPSVRIGRGAVIASNSVVTKDIPSMSIAAGIPSKVIGERRRKLQYQLFYQPWFE
jgi:maltose O-acetyltransferase